MQRVGDGGRVVLDRGVSRKGNLFVFAQIVCYQEEIDPLSSQFLQKISNFSSTLKIFRAISKYWRRDKLDIHRLLHSF